MDVLHTSGRLVGGPTAVMQLGNRLRIVCGCFWQLVLIALRSGQQHQNIRLLETGGLGIPFNASIMRLRPCSASSSRTFTRATPSMARPYWTAAFVCHSGSAVASKARTASEKHALAEPIRGLVRDK